MNEHDLFRLAVEAGFVNDGQRWIAPDDATLERFAELVVLLHEEEKLWMREP